MTSIVSDKFQGAPAQWSETAEGGKPPRPPVAYAYRGDPDLKPRMDATVFVLSQSDLGRRLLNSLAESGYKLGFGDCGGFNGICNHTLKRIDFAEGIDNPAMMAVLLAHEIRHVEQLRKLGIDSDTTDTLKTALRHNRIIEADAYAHDAVVAIELLLGSPDGPAEQVTYPDVMPLIEPSLHRTRTLAQVAKDPASLKDGRALAAGFDAFFDLYNSRPQYDEHVLKTYEKLDDDDLRQARRLSREQAAEDILARLGGVAKGSYVLKFMPDLDMDAPRYAGVFPETLLRLQDFGTRLQRLGRDEKNCGAGDLPIHQPEPITPERKAEEFKKSTAASLEKLRESGFPRISPRGTKTPSGIM